MVLGMFYKMRILCGKISSAKVAVEGLTVLCQILSYLHLRQIGGRILGMKSKRIVVL